ncbi:hypothetical protein SAMN06265379_102139 [Saccharicrinis carchari]|uniref:Uncharacterized protein n=1 Tax=Saccharicrinis carchari TaxID=1168039 RepID=A0A521BVZ4_SACCC|nr:hypothetical protein [Saccharicrinis carchari]SMO51377.1 hypothetical protein SAMN06265379_102139 [Saccharicrinis carchari]
MNYIRIVIRLFIFLILLVSATLILEFLITNVYILLLDYYSLPQSDSDITILAFAISLVFVGLLSYGTGYWQLRKAIE